MSTPTTPLARKDAERGAAVVETALATTISMMLVTGIFDVGRMHHMRSTLQHAVSQSTRFATTGDTITDPCNPAMRLSREASIIQLIKQTGGLEDIDDDDIEMYAVNAAGETSPGAGGPGDVVVVRISYGVAPITPGLGPGFSGGRRELTCPTRLRNEEFVKV